MIFFLVMPGLFGGFGNYFVPIFQGSPEVVYPRVNNFSILILSLSLSRRAVIKGASLQMTAASFFLFQLTTSRTLKRLSGLIRKY